MSMKKIKLICMLILFALTISLSAQTKSKDLLVFEIVKDYVNTPRISGTTFYFYQSGRIDCRKHQRSLGKKTINYKKAKCFQTAPAKISELIKVTEEADFRQAKESYKFFKGGIDWGNSVYITHFSQNGKQEINLVFTDFQVEPIPLSLKKFLQKLGEIDKTLKVAAEL